jgi:uncharacterized protein YbjT (DUF2867 family)
MPEKKIIAVIGATGAQGGGLVRAILADKSGEFAARAITRNPSSEKAQALKSAGAEVVAGDADKPETLGKAFAGAYGAFLITNFWEHLSPERELTQARNLAQAVKAAGVQHVIWSTLENTRKWVPLESDQMPTLQGKYKVPHFDAKGEADDIFRQLGVPTTFLLTSFYWDNLIYFGAGPQRMPDGTLALVFPMDDKKLPGIAAEDIGKAALGVFKRRGEFINKTVAIAGEHLSGSEMARELSKALGQEVKYQNVPPEVYRGLGFPGADDLGNMFQFKRDFNDYFVGVRDLAFTRSLNPELQTFDKWLAKHAEQIPIPAGVPG